MDRICPSDVGVRAARFGIPWPFRPIRAFLHREKHMARALSACLVLPSDGLHDADILRHCARRADLVVIQRFGPFAHAVRLVISVSPLMFIPVSFRSLGGCDAVSVHACSCAGFPIPCLGRFPWFLL